MPEILQTTLHGLRRRLGPATLDLNNRIFTFLFGFSAAFLGSAVSAFVTVSAVWSLVRHFQGRFPYKFERGATFVGYSSLILFVSVLMFSSINYAIDFRHDNIYNILNYIPLLFFFPILARMNVSCFEDSFPALSKGACLGLFVSAVLALYQYYVLRIGPEGLAGNQGPYALFCAICALIVHIGAFVERRPWRAVNIVAYFCGLLCVILAGQRIVLMIVVLNAIVVSVAFRRLILRKLSVGRILPGLALLAVAIWLGWPMISLRVNATLNEASKITRNSDMDNSVGLRLTLWDSAARAIKDRPLLGYGQKPLSDILDPYLPPRFSTRMHFTHAHNAYLDIMLRGGLLSLLGLFLYLLAPLWAVFGMETETASPVRRTLVVGLVTSYAVNGLSNIIVKDGLYISLFIFVVVVALGRPREFQAARRT